MQDEMWMRGWNDGHVRFSSDLDKVVTASTGRIAALFQRRAQTAVREAPVSPSPLPPATPC
ncbi:hypothetical protein [Sphingopyxis sp.]|uniref:hypothetical protein n=1 Tax=Sphingopyxis sp. TaxID=1908224 RepID=UPI003D0C424B